VSALLTIEGLTVAYGAAPVVRGVSLTLAAGEVLGLVGESGSGKSTLGMAVLGLLDPAARVEAGAIALGGDDLIALPAQQRRALCGSTIALIPQEPMAALNPTLRIGRQLDLVLRRHGKGDATARRQIAEAALASVMIADPPRILASYPFQLSGGQLQRVLIALAFALGPRLIIADEPTTALDMSAQGAVLDLLVERARGEGAGVLLISHNLPLVRRYADRVAVMRRGAIAEEGTAAEVLAAPAHPYTTALIAALPANTPPRTPLPVPEA
jgi:ABC-type glutathione transport system ATPase component